MIMFTRLKPISIVRLLNTSSFNLAVDKAQLSKLRKKTGFPFINCKKALEKFENDAKQAEAWLKEEAQKEGWAKASKLQNRPMSSGLVGLIIDNSFGAMVEVNCETDFVARNEKFQKLVENVTRGCLTYGKKCNEGKILWTKDTVKEIPSGEGSKLGDQVALEVGNIGENIAMKRGVYVQAPGGANIGKYIHAAGPDKMSTKTCFMGKYGSLVVFTRADTENSKLSIEEIGRQLGQHIVGMNPKEVGLHEVVDTESDSSDSDSSDEEDNKQEKEEEIRMLQQEFLLDPSRTVLDFVRENGITVIDFVRLECGEVLPGDDS